MIYSPQQLFVGATFILVILLLVIVLPTHRGNKQSYEQLPSILTPAERHFYTVLSSILQSRVLIMAKVRIADILKVRRNIPNKSFWGHFSKISQKHIDFVLVDPVTFKTLCLIELDDKSHLRPDRSMRDRFVNHIMAQTGIPLYRFQVRRRYDRSKILRTLSPLLDHTK